MVRIKSNVPLAPLTTFKLGGPARFFARVKTLDDLREALRFANDQRLPRFILGGGSNVLFPDSGFEGLVIRMDIRSVVFIKDGGYRLVTAGAGEVWDDVVKESVQQGLGGIENLSLIPGSVGGAVYQNIGAYGVELKDVLQNVEVLDAKTLRVRRMDCRQCCFHYRESIFQRRQQYLVLGATLRLSERPKPNTTYPDLRAYFDGRPRPSLDHVRRAVIAIRKRKFPYDERLGNAGSFFKNPVVSVTQLKSLLERYPNLKSFPFGRRWVKLPAAQLIEKAGWKGKRFGHFGVSEKHALVLVHYGNGATKELLTLARDIADDVEKKFGIRLSPEVRILGARASTV